MARIDPDDPRSPYHQIADDLRIAIAAGELRPGSRMKSSRELAGEYGVAAMTVHQAIRVLRDEGLVDSYQGRGVFVRSGDSAAVRPVDVQGQIREVRDLVDDLAGRVGETIEPELVKLRQHIGTLQAQLMELYARTGQPYPHAAANDQPQRRRRASGS
jgi:DNA-binding GntR family transcriptional regulator